jgi:hypothetical protein
MQNLQANFLLFYFKTYWFWVWTCLRPHSRDAEAADTKLRSISIDKKRKKFLNAKKRLLANFQHDCLTTGLRTVRQCLKLMIFVISSTVVKELNAKFGANFLLYNSKLFSFVFESAGATNAKLRSISVDKKEKSF